MALTKDYPNTDWATKTETTIEPRITYPFHRWGQTSGYIVERDYVQERTSYSPATLGTTDATYTGAYLFEETPPQTAGTGLVQFTYRFGTVPSSFNVNTFEVVTFPGYYESLDDAPAETNFRPPQSILSVVTWIRRFTYDTTPADLTIVGQPLAIVKTGTDDTIVSYVDTATVPTYATYTGWVSGPTYYQPLQVKVSRAYGAGYIWMSEKPQTYAQ